jgi:hypothetical protein
MKTSTAVTAASAIPAGRATPAARSRTRDDGVILS